jgi:hypothetical protein
MDSWHFMALWLGNISIALAQNCGVRNGKSDGMYLVSIDDVVPQTNGSHPIQFAFIVRRLSRTTRIICRNSSQC